MRYRTGAEWLEPGDGEQRGWSVMLPALALVDRLAASETFVSGVERVGQGDESAADLARRYVRRAGRGKRLIEDLIEQAAADADRRAIVLYGRVAITPRSPEPTRRNFRKRDWKRAAVLLIRRSDGCCLECGARMATDAAGEYCSPCGPNHSQVKRAHREQILHLLDSAADALGVE